MPMHPSHPSSAQHGPHGNSAWRCGPSTEALELELGWARQPDSIAHEVGGIWFRRGATLGATMDATTRKRFITVIEQADALRAIVDPEEEPFKSKYEARKLLVSVPRAMQVESAARSAKPPRPPLPTLTRCRRRPARAWSPDAMLAASVRRRPA